MNKMNNPYYELTHQVSNIALEQSKNDQYSNHRRTQGPDSGPNITPAQNAPPFDKQNGNIHYAANPSYDARNYYETSLPTSGHGNYGNAQVSHVQGQSQYADQNQYSRSYFPSAANFVRQGNESNQIGHSESSTMNENASLSPGRQYVASDNWQNDPRNYGFKQSSNTIETASSFRASSVQQNLYIPQQESQLSSQYPSQIESNQIQQTMQASGRPAYQNFTNVQAGNMPMNNQNVIQPPMMHRGMTNFIPNSANLSQNNGSSSHHVISEKTPSHQNTDYCSQNIDYNRRTSSFNQQKDIEIAQVNNSPSIPRSVYQYQNQPVQFDVRPLGQQLQPMNTRSGLRNPQDIQQRADGNFPIVESIQQINQEDYKGNIKQNMESPIQHTTYSNNIMPQIYSERNAAIADAKDYVHTTPDRYYAYSQSAVTFSSSIPSSLPAFSRTPTSSPQVLASGSLHDGGSVSHLQLSRQGSSDFDNQMQNSNKEGRFMEPSNKNQSFNVARPASVGVNASNYQNFSYPHSNSYAFSNNYPGNTVSQNNNANILSDHRNSNSNEIDPQQVDVLRQNSIENTGSALYKPANYDPRLPRQYQQQSNGIASHQRNFANPQTAVFSHPQQIAQQQNSNNTQQFSISGNSATYQINDTMQARKPEMPLTNQEFVQLHAQQNAISSQSNTDMNSPIYTRQNSNPAFISYSNPVGRISNSAYPTEFQTQKTDDRFNVASSLPVDTSFHSTHSEGTNVIQRQFSIDQSQRNSANSLGKSIGQHDQAVEITPGHFAGQPVAIADHLARRPVATADHLAGQPGQPMAVNSGCTAVQTVQPAYSVGNFGQHMAINSVNSALGQPIAKDCMNPIVQPQQHAVVNAARFAIQSGQPVARTPGYSADRSGQPVAVAPGHLAGQPRQPMAITRCNLVEQPGQPLARTPSYSADCSGQRVAISPGLFAGQPRQPIAITRYNSNEQPGHPIAIAPGHSDLRPRQPNAMNPAQSTVHAGQPMVVRSVHPGDIQSGSPMVVNSVRSIPLTDQTEKTVAVNPMHSAGQPIVIMPGYSSNVVTQRTIKQSFEPKLEIILQHIMYKQGPAFVKMRRIVEEILDTQDDVLNFKGRRGDRDYILIEEMLTKHLLSLDGIPAQGNEEVRLSRKSIVKQVQGLLVLLEMKAKT